jgi:hypothetical protein
MFFMLQRSKELILTAHTVVLLTRWLLAAHGHP